MVTINLNELLAGRTLYWLSKETGVRWATLAAMSTGKARRINLDVLDLICKVLECQPGDLLTRGQTVKGNKKRAIKARKR